MPISHDLPAVFDTIDQIFLLNTFYKTGVNDRAVTLLHSNPEDRTQCVMIVGFLAIQNLLPKVTSKIDIGAFSFFSVPVASPLSAWFLDYHVFAADKALFWQFGFSTILVANLFLLIRVMGNFAKLLCSRKLEFFSSKTRFMFCEQSESLQLNFLTWVSKLLR